jgi:hypothetical protein
MTYSICELDALNPGLSKILKALKIRTTDKLLELAKTPKGRRDLASKTGIDAKEILRIANMADRMRVRGIGRENAELLEAAGVDTVRELKYRNPANLAAAITEANRKRKLVRLLPSEKVVGRWIEHAKKLPIKISY